MDKKEMPCPLCSRADAFYVFNQTWKCKRLKGGCGKIFNISALRKKSKKSKVIVCIDCDAVREVASQDAFQVKRCIQCQKKLRSESRRRR